MPELVDDRDEAVAALGEAARVPAESCRVEHADAMVRLAGRLHCSQRRVIRVGVARDLEIGRAFRAGRFESDVDDIFIGLERRQKSRLFGAAKGYGRNGADRGLEIVLTPGLKPIGNDVPADAADNARTGYMSSTIV